jgi:NAD(P)-dependent dehydrogenase (short-subunit alcohol dehydrogenase family)
MSTRVALVTGASSGIGRAVARELGGNGFVVALGARRVSRLEEAATEVREGGGEAFAHPLDVSDPNSVARWFDAAEIALGPVDVLVNNAGTATPGPLHEITTDDLKREVETNLLGSLYASQLAIRSLLGRGAPGDLVYVSSDAVRHARPRMVAYSATKAGLEMTARSLALELEGSGIRATTIRVGPTVTEFGATWDRPQLEELMQYWPRFGLQRHAGVLDVADVARAVLVAVTAPPGVHFDTIELQPEAPPDGGPAQVFDPPT